MEWIARWVDWGESVEWRRAIKRDSYSVKAKARIWKEPLLSWKSAY
jgi:hypothetical protein